MPSRRQVAAALSQTQERPTGERNGSKYLYTRALAEAICDRLAAGEPLNVICQDQGMPSEAAVRQWARDDRGADPETGAQGFSSMYARARDLGYDSIAEGLLTITDADLRGPDGYVDNGEVGRLRLLSDNRRWLLAKLRPKQYGDKVTQEIVGDGDNPLITRIELVPIDPRPKPMIEHDDGPIDGSKPSKRRKR